MKQNVIILVLLFLFLAGSAGTALAQDPPDPERPRLIRGERDLVPLAAGLRWWVPQKLSQGRVPRASKVKVPKIDFEGLTTLGTAYKIEWDGGPLRVPAELEFKLPRRAFREGVQVVLVRQDEDGIAFIPARTNPETRTATAWTTRFSTWTPATLADAVAYTHAIVKGDVTQVLPCEQEMKILFFDVTGSALVAGEPANFIVALDGAEPYIVIPPIPEWLFGTYTFHRMIGCSDDYLFGNPGMNPERVIDQPITYTQDMEVAPSTFNLHGVVKDEDGNPKEGIRVEIHADDVVYGTSSRAGGAYKVWMVGAGGAQRFPERSVRYVLKDEEHDCPESTGTLDVIVGEDNERDLVYEGKGIVTGIIYDGDEACETCRVELKDVHGQSWSEIVDPDGRFEFRDIPVGTAVVTARCAEQWGEDTDSATVEVTCDDEEAESVELRLHCRCDVCGIVYDDEEPCDGAELELRDAYGETYRESSGADGRFEFREIPSGAAVLTTRCPPGTGDDSDTRSIEVACDEEEMGEIHVTLDCGQPGDYQATILIEKGSPMTVHAKLDGVYEFSVDEAGNISGSGDGTFSITAGGGVCSGSVGATIGGGGTMKRDKFLFELTFDEEGVMDFVCAGESTPVPESLDAFEDEGLLEVPIQSKKPFQATLEKTTPGPAPAQWRYTIDVVKTSE